MGNTLFDWFLPPPTTGEAEEAARLCDREADDIERDNEHIVGIPRDARLFRLAARALRSRTVTDEMVRIASYEYARCMAADMSEKGSMRAALTAAIGKGE